MKRAYNLANVGRKAATALVGLASLALTSGCQTPLYMTRDLDPNTPTPSKVISGTLTSRATIVKGEPNYLQLNFKNARNSNEIVQITYPRNKEDSRFMEKIILPWLDKGTLIELGVKNPNSSTNIPLSELKNIRTGHYPSNEYMLRFWK